MVTAFEKRLNHLGVDVIWTDFFGQIPQLLNEIALCALQAKPYRGPSADYRYGQRVTNWYREWDRKIRRERFVVAQDRCQRFLSDAKAQLSRALPTKQGEQFKLEVWVRRKPETRKLSLWCSSEMTWRSSNSMHQGLITNNSNYVAVRAFCRGHVERGALPDGASRWKTYFSLPIILEERSWQRIPVGVISLLSTKPERASMLDTLNDDVSLYEAVVRTLSDVGKVILAPSQYGQPSGDPPGDAVPA